MAKRLPMYAVVVVNVNELEKYDNMGYEIIPGTVHQDGAPFRCIMRLRDTSPLNVTVTNFIDSSGE